MYQQQVGKENMRTAEQVDVGVRCTKDLWESPRGHLVGQVDNGVWKVLQKMGQRQGQRG